MTTFLQVLLLEGSEDKALKGNKTELKKNKFKGIKVREKGSKLPARPQMEGPLLGLPRFPHHMAGLGVACQGGADPGKWFRHE